MSKTSKEWVQLLETVNMSKVSRTKVTVTTTALNEDGPLLDIPLDKLFEFYGNLIMNNFSVSEALEITAKVAANARTS